jgi:membrane-associated phospholipid phosphatase
MNPSSAGSLRNVVSRLAFWDLALTGRMRRPFQVKCGRTGQIATRLFSRLGDGWLYAIVFLCLRFSGNRMEANRVASAVLCAWGLGSMLKFAFRRNRTVTMHRRLRIFKRISSWSFPSQHSAVAVAFAFALWPSPLPVVLALAICASRVLIGAHYLGDVLAGIAVGLVAGRLA